MTTALIAKHIKKFYGLEGVLKPLHGEIEQNYQYISSKQEVFVVKLSPASKKDRIFFETALLDKLTETKKNNTPHLIKDKLGNAFTIISNEHKETFILRILSWVPGRPWGSVNPIVNDHREELGKQLGKITAALEGFEHPHDRSKNDWDLAQALWVKKHTVLFSNEEQGLLAPFITSFEKNLTAYDKLPKGVVHNDANDQNIMLSQELINPSLTGIIDFGDACFTQIINDVAIGCTYTIMGCTDPLEAALPFIGSYHSQYSLSETSLDHLYTAIGMRLVVSLSKAAINKKAHPENPYLLHSEKDAWALLKKWSKVSPQFAKAAFRKACGYTAHKNTTAFIQWADKQEVSFNDLFLDLHLKRVHHLDLSVSSLWVENEARFNDLDYFEFKIQQLQKKHPDAIIAGGYLEPRPLYTSEDYDLSSNSGPISRCVHLGVDFWLPAQTAVHSPFEAKVVMALNRKGEKEYGGFAVLEHDMAEGCFYTLYGHLDPASIQAHKVGDALHKGSLIGKLGTTENNGHWAPHLHFQILLDLLEYKEDFPGVQTRQTQEIWRDLCPDPNFLFKQAGLSPVSKTKPETLLDFRKKHLGKSLSLQYNQPLYMVRGSGTYLLDHHGNKYLDTVNNVAHLGHEHPEVVAAGQAQMAVLNTNTRYLHLNINQAAQSLIETLPSTLNVVHFVNSGSEANELALRMATAYTGSHDILASKHGYHGNTHATIGVSSYKFDGKGGQGKPSHTHLFSMPDAFRGRYTGPNAGEAYAQELAALVQDLKNKGRSPAALLIEPIISCGGQVPLAQGFLEKAYKTVRDAGGLCISDEVQTGCGRMGSHFWGFELYGVIPDIVSIGKPLGNGHPVAAVVCTQEVAKSFANGMEFFNTFGGNPVSCAIAHRTLQIIKEEKLQENAAVVGGYLKTALASLSKKHLIIKDVRGQGLFLGIELLNKKMQALPEQASYLVNRMKDFGILMSTDGPDHNVIKIKPPMCISSAQAKRIVDTMDLVLSEDFLKQGAE
ncbi:MAG: aminotransferase class III-fold pyridoxal phosphate-dependent enzyme [Flavobacteriia bacterium]|nr:aminotransferase class III-fold pyridoxal phosphate-dependent enzyme [Flavobacteriia bacterium]